MRFIDRPLIGNQRCAITKRGKDSRGFIHTNQILPGWDQEVIISAAAAEEMGKLVGMVPKADLDVILERVRAMGDEIDSLRERVSDFEQLDELKEKVLS